MTTLLSVMMCVEILLLLNFNLFSISSFYLSSGSLREISLDVSKILCSKGNFVIPGQKLCPQCRNKLVDKEPEPEDIETEEEVFPENDNEIERDIMVESTRSILNSTLCELDVSPLKVHSVPSSYKHTLGKRKLKQVEEAVTKKIATVLDVTESDLDITEDNETSKEIQTKAADLDYLVDCMKEKLKISNRRQQLQILTLVPKSWSVRKAAKEFSVSKGKIQKAKALRDQKGIIGYPELVKRNRISQDIIELIQAFYCDDEYSRPMPGKKDYVSVSRNNHMSKRLI